MKSIGYPTDSFTPDGARFRLGAFWNQGGDHWWSVGSSLFGTLPGNPLDFLKQLVTTSPVDQEKARILVRRAVDDSIGKIQQFALPYFERVADWAKAQDYE